MSLASQLISRAALFAACATMVLAHAPPAAAQAQGQNWFVPGQGQSQQAQSQPAAGKGSRHKPRAGTTAPSPVTTADLPPPGAEPPPPPERTEEELQAEAAKLPQPPAPPLPPITSGFYNAVATGDAVKVSASGVNAALPAPLDAATTYYVIKGNTSNEVELAASASDATGNSPITLTSAGSGTLHLTAPVAHTGQTNIGNDFSVQMPATLKLLPGGSAPPTPIVGVLGVPDVMRLSSAAQAVDRVINARKAKLQAEVDQAQASWQEMAREMQKDAPKMKPDQAVARERAMRERYEGDRHRLQDKNRMIQEAAQVALGQIERTLIGIIRQVAESRGMNLVLHRSQVALNVQEFDITQAVADQLNRALPTVQIPPEDVDPAKLPKDWGSAGATAAAK